MHPLLLSTLLVGIVATGSPAQSPETRILKQTSRYGKPEIQKISSQVLAMKGKLPLLEKKEIGLQRNDPNPKPLELPLPENEPKNIEELAPEHRRRLCHRKGCDRNL